MQVGSFTFPPFEWYFILLWIFRLFSCHSYWISRSLRWLLLLIPESRRFETFVSLVKLFILLVLPCVMVIRFTFALLIAILSLPYRFFKSSLFIKLNSLFVRLRQSTQKLLDLQFFISAVPDIPQQFQELIYIFIHGLLSQSQLMELLDLFIIIPVRKVFLLEILLELFPLQFPFTNLLYVLEVFPPNGCPSNQIEYGNSCLHVS